MIEIFAVTLLTFALAMTGMALGLLAKRRELAKGCMTLGTAGDEAWVCRVCGQPIGGNNCTGGAPPAKSGVNTA